MRIADTMVSRAESISCDNGDGVITQDGMTRAAFDALACMNARPGHQVAVVRAQRDGASLVAFDGAHASWLAYRGRFAGFTADCHAGGPIQALIRAVTLDSLTGIRIDEVDTQLGLGGAIEVDTRG